MTARHGFDRAVLSKDSSVALYDAVDFFPAHCLFSASALHKYPSTTMEGSLRQRSNMRANSSENSRAS